MPGNQRNLELKLCLILFTAVKQKTMIQLQTPKKIKYNYIQKNLNDGVIDIGLIYK